MPETAISATVDRLAGTMGMTRPVLVAATLVGAGLGVVYTLSPVTTCGLLLTPWLFWWAGRDLSGRERSCVLSVIGIALTLRLLALSVFFVTTDHVNQPFGVLQGDEEAIKKVSLWLHTLALGGRIAPTDAIELAEPYGKSSLPYAGAFLHFVFGPSPYALHLLNVACFMTGAVILHRLARQAYGPLPALGGLVVVLFLPSLFVWSISALKEPAYFSSSTVALYGFVRGFESRRFLRRVRWALVASGAIWLAETLRPIAFAGIGGGLILGLLGRSVTGSRVLGTATMVALIAGGAVALRQPAVQAKYLQYVRVAALAHRGHVATPGYTYRLLDPEVYARIYSESDRQLASLEFDEAARFTIRAAASFVTVPLPWQAESPSAIAFLPQQMFWYVLVGLAIVGLGAGLTQERSFTYLLAGLILCSGAIIAVSNGNIGTLVRMRDMVVPFIALLGALGACAAVEWVSAIAGRQPGPAGS